MNTAEALQVSLKINRQFLESMLADYDVEVRLSKPRKGRLAYYERILKSTFESLAELFQGMVVINDGQFLIPYTGRVMELFDNMTQYGDNPTQAVIRYMQKRRMT